MSYNREWDNGKDSWNDGGGWYDNGSRGNVRGREEEDYYGDGKRRKYNEGVRHVRFVLLESPSHPRRAMMQVKAGMMVDTMLAITTKTILRRNMHHHAVATTLVTAAQVSAAAVAAVDTK